jgi:hypothetical protein
MSAALADSIAWSHMTREAKQRAAVVPLIPGREYEVRGDWGTARVRCLGKQFRIVSATFRSYGDTVPLFGEGWVVQLSDQVLATIKPIIPATVPAIEV